MDREYVVGWVGLWTDRRMKDLMDGWMDRWQGKPNCKQNIDVCGNLQE